MKNATLTLAILITLLSPVAAQTIRRQQVIDNAKEFANLSWRMNTRNTQDQCYSPIWIKTKFPATSSNIKGMAYCWGCGKKISQFQSGIAGNGKAGNGCTKSQGAPGQSQPNTFGVDCSGLVTRALGRSETHLGTSELEPLFTVLSDRKNMMRMGDIFNKKNDHTAIFWYQNSSGKPVVYEASGTDWKVSERTYSWSYFDNYKALRYKDLQDGGLAKVNQGLTVSPSTVRRGQTISVIFHLKELEGAAITYDTVTVAIVDRNGVFKFDLPWRTNFTIPANGEKTFLVPANNGQGYVVATARIDLPAGTYKAVARGRIGGGWFDFLTTGSGVNGRTFTVTN
jgi:hypothetical protein